MNDEDTGTDSVQVDPDTLRTFAGNLETEAGALAALDIAGLSTAAGALPGTGFEAPARHTAELAGACLHRIGDRITTVAGLLRTDAGSYEMSEAEFTSTLDTVGMDVPA